MKQRLITVLACALLALPGCETIRSISPAANAADGKTNDNAPPDDEAVVAAADREGAILAGLAQPGLPKGECGMVLWTLDEDRPLPVFRYVAGKKAEISLSGTPIELTRLEANGVNAFGVSEEQLFSSEDGLRVSVNVRFSLGFDGGSYLERGVVTVETPSGWRTVAPSAGIAGCRAS